MNRKPLPAIVLLYLLSYAFLWVVILKNNINPLSESILIAHLLWFPAFAALIMEIVKRKQLNIPVLKNLFEFRLISK